MKTLNFKLIQTFTLICALALNTIAYAGEAPPVGANVNVTRDRIQQVMDQLLTRGANIGFSVTDYREWAPKFKAKVETALEKYENVLQTEILPASVIWANRYNEIEKSKAYSESQKTILLASVNGQADAQYLLLSSRHAKALRDLYTEIFNDINIKQKYHGDTVTVVPRAHRKETAKYSHTVKMSFEFAGRSYHFTKQLYSEDSVPLPEQKHICYNVIDSLEHNQDIAAKIGSNWYDIEAAAKSVLFMRHYEMKSVCGQISNQLPNDSIFTAFYEESINNHAKIFHQIIYPILKEPCKSSMCLSLVAGDLNFTRALIKSTIDQPIEIKLGKFNKKINGAGIAISEMTSMFNRTDYPEDNLPFDTN